MIKTSAGLTMRARELRGYGVARCDITRGRWAYFVEGLRFGLFCLTVLKEDSQPPVGALMVRCFSDGG